MMYDLPISVEIDGEEYPIRWDFRAALDIIAALNDPELNDTEKTTVILTIFYPDFDQMPPELYENAVKKCFWFLDCGEEKGQEKGQKKPLKLVDWEKDFKIIVAPINRIAGHDIRGDETLHWWSFIAFYYEIGDCLFAQIVRIRKRKAEGKPLDKSDQKWYRENRDLVDIKVNYTETENALLKQWGAG